MLTPDEIESKLDRILLKVQKPGRYVGGELNSVVKDWDKISTKVALSSLIFMTSAYQTLD